MGLTSAEYAKEGGVRCPRCLSHDIEGGSIEIDAAGASQSVRCNDCGATWVDVYSLVRYEDLEK